jgi:hypothetical protein
MKRMIVGNGVGRLGKEGYGEIYWVNHIFLPTDAIIMSDGTISQSNLDHTALCGKSYGCLNGEREDKPNCSICIKIAAGIGNNIKGSNV